MLLSYDIVEEIIQVADRYSEKQTERLDRLVEQARAVDVVPVPAPASAAAHAPGE